MLFALDSPLLLSVTNVTNVKNFQKDIVSIRGTYALYVTNVTNVKNVINGRSKPPPIHLNTSVNFQNSIHT